jgi:hypothetical protein
VFEGRRALRINLEADSVIVIATDYSGGMAPHTLNHLMRTRTIVNKVAQTPQHPHPATSPLVNH